MIVRMPSDRGELDQLPLTRFVRSGGLLLRARQRG